MASTTITSTFAGSINNGGLQVAYNAGSITYQPTIYQAAERPETPPQPARFVPFPRDPDFVDHATCFDEVNKRFSAPASRVALVGLGGIGKSQLAIEYCYRISEQSPRTWVFWVHASNTDRLDQSFREIANKAKIRGRGDAQADIFKLVCDWLQDEKNGPWLLVVDNVDDIDVISSLPTNSRKKHLSSYLPPSSHGSVLITSRTRRAAAQIVEPDNIIHIEPMTTTAARLLLEKKLGYKVDKDEPIAELAMALDYMPLALVQAASYIREREPRCSVRQYVEDFRQSDNRKMSLLSHEAGHLRREEESSNAVLITWQISFNHIRRSRQTAANLLSLMSFFDRQGIPDSVLRRQSDTTDERFEEDVLTLRDYLFIRVTENPNTFEMHRLIQLATREWLESQDQAYKWRNQFISSLSLEIPSTPKYEGWSKWQVLYPHVKAALEQRPDDDDATLGSWSQLLAEAAGYAWRRGKAGEAEHMVKIAIKVGKQVYGEESEETLSSMTILAVVLHAQGQNREAEALIRKTLELCTKVLGPTHLETMTNMENMGAILYDLERYNEAEEIQRKSLSLWKKKVGAEHVDTLSSMSNLALILEEQGNLKEAEALNRDVLQQKEKILGQKHPATLLSRNNLASLLDRLGSYKDAEKMDRQTLKWSIEVLGEEDDSTLQVLSNLGWGLRRQCRYEESESLLRKALEGRRKVLGSEHPDTLTTLANLADVLDYQKKFEEAGTLYKEAVAGRVKTLGPEHSKTAVSEFNLADFLARQNCYGESLAHFERAYRVIQTLYQEDHPSAVLCRKLHAKAKLGAEKEQLQLLGSSTALSLSRVLRRFGIIKFKENVEDNGGEQLRDMTRVTFSNHTSPTFEQ